MTEADDDTRTRYLAAGLLDPDAAGAAERVALLAWLEQLGFTVDELAAAADVAGLAADRRLLPDEFLTPAVAADLVGVDADELDDALLAFGFSRLEHWSSGADGVTLDEARAVALISSLREMFTPAEARSFLRVIGASMGRIADAAVSLFLADVESGLLAAGESELVISQQAYDAIGLLDGLSAGLDPILRRHVAQAIDRTRRSTISETERLEYRYAVGFVDLVGFTEIAGGMSSQHLAGFLREFEDRAYDAVTAVRARVVKLIGDEVMFVASDPADACRAGASLMDGFGSEYEHIVPRGGVAYGSVLVRGGDYYGSVVNLASRLVDEAVPQELLVTAELAEAAAPSCEFEPAGRRMVKGFADPVTVFSLVH